MKVYGIIGFPLGHTMSPTLHNWGFDECGITAEYKTWPTTPEALPAFMERFRNERIGGLSITIPHKQAVIPMVDRLTKRAERVGAVNTLWWDNDVLMGDNTDVAGVVHPVRSRGKIPASALVLGAGGAARAAVAACRELKIPDVLIANRTRAKAESIATDFGINVVDWSGKEHTTPELLINSTPLGMSGDLENLRPWQGEYHPNCLVFDLVYNPLETKLLQKAASAGCETIQGIEMFLHQGLEQFRLWTKQELDSKEARTLLLEKLALSRNSPAK